MDACSDLKQCCTCHQQLPRAAFYRARAKSDGLQTRCKGCMKAASPARAAYTEAYNARWRADHPEVMRARWRQAYLKRRETRPVEHQRWQTANTERLRKWAAEHPDQARVYLSRRRARQLNLPGDFTAAEWQSLCARYENRCVCCRQAKPLTVDHVIPLSQGGDNTIDNIQPLCRSCNSYKGQASTDYRKAETEPA